MDWSGGVGSNISSGEFVLLFFKIMFIYLFMCEYSLFKIYQIKVKTRV